MKKLLLTLALSGITVLGHAQGTIMWGNTTLTRILVAPWGGTASPPTAEDGYTFSLYFGPAGSTAEQLVFSGATAVIGGVPGILSGASSVLALPGTDGGQTITLQIRATHPDGLPMINPPVRQITLGNPGGPGAVIWTQDPATRTFYVAPEPSTLAVLGVCGGFLALAVRRRRLGPGITPTRSFQAACW